MKKIRIIAFITGVLSVLSSSAQQQTVTLQDALTAATNNFPVAHQKMLIEEAGKQNKDLLDASLLPQFNVIGQATYQSEVTSLDVPGVPKGAGQKPGNYNVGLDMRLPLTQFGTVQTRKQLEEAQTNLVLNQVDADMQQVREKVTSLFGNLLLQKESRKILAIRLLDLDSQKRKVAVAVSSGAVLKSNQLVLESEILTTEQKIDDANALIKGITSQLAVLTGLPLNENTNFQFGPVQLNNVIVRPELKVFEAQKRILDVRSALIKKESKPGLYVFGQGSYGRPGFNFLDNNPRIYGIGGVGLSWNLNNLFTQSRQQRVIAINKELVNTREEVFNLNIKSALSDKQAEIDKYQSVIARDAQIVKNRQEIMRATASQLENGVITSTEYLTELNAQNAAQLNLILHQVQLNMATAQYNILSGY